MTFKQFRSPANGHEQRTREPRLPLAVETREDHLAQAAGTPVDCKWKNEKIGEHSLRGASMLAADLIRIYMQAKTTQRGREDFRNADWWCSRMGREPVSALTTSLILKHLDHLASYGRSPSTVANYLRFLRRICAWGTLMGYLPADPCAGMTLPKQQIPPLRALSEEEESRLCMALGPPYSLWVKFAIETGLKQSEQFTLRWRDIDLERAQVLLPHPTTGAVSALTLSSKAVIILRQLRDMQTPSMWVFPDPKNPFRAVNIHAFYVGRWVTAVHGAGIAWCAWKDLRHTCGVRLTQQKVPVEDILRVMRQRENKKAYIYRAYVTGSPKIVKPFLRLPAAPVFAGEAEESELRAVLLRELGEAPVTFGEAARLYALHHLRQRPTRQTFENIYRQLWCHWAERPLAGLTRQEIRIWYLGLAETPSYANKALTLLRSLYNWAIDFELITVANPAVRIRRFPTASRERFLTVEELQRMMTGLQHVSVKARAYLSVLLFTGARRSEARLMQWADIDETTRLWKKIRTKNGSSQFVPLPIQVMEAFRSLPRMSRFVFPGQNGQPWSRASAEKTWKLIRRQWGLDDVRLHDLRRTCASYLAMHGENLPTIQNVLNHRSLTPHCDLCPAEYEGYRPRLTSTSRPVLFIARDAYRVHRAA